MLRDDMAHLQVIPVTSGRPSVFHSIRLTQEVHSEPVGKAGVTSDDVSGPRAALGSLVILRTQHRQPAVASRGA